MYVNRIVWKYEVGKVHVGAYGLMSAYDLRVGL